MFSNDFSDNVLSRVTTFSHSFLVFLVPSFLWPQSGKDSKRAIGAFDGLRGIGALIVFHEHWAFSFAEPPGDDLNQYFWYKPFLNLIFSGIAMVDVFFFMSGYVLVHRPLKLIHSGDISSALSNISSAVFRRGIRLNLPCFAIIVMAAILMRLGAFNASARVMEHRPETPYRPTELLPPYFDTLGGQVWDVLMQCLQLADQAIPWRGIHLPVETIGNTKVPPLVSTHYDLHLWTIPVEFRGSMLIFMMVIATARFRTVWRLTIHALFFVNCMMTERFCEALFVAGLTCAEIDIIRSERNPRRDSPDLEKEEIEPSRWVLKHALIVLGLVVGLFLLSVPRLRAFEGYGYINMIAALPANMVLKDRFVRAIGAIMVTWIAADSKLVAPLLTNPVSQYLGKISFAIYLCQGTVIKVFGYSLFPFLSATMVGSLPAGQAYYTPEQFAGVYLTGYVILLPILIWVCDIFTRAVDIPSMDLARWLERKMKAPATGSVLLA